jgi:ABC-type branched-subunit amino acid transport system ATPase component
MLVKSLHIENLLTFDTFDLDLEGGTHTIVGPNGSGKSNVVRLFDLVAKALDFSSGNNRNLPYTQAADQVLRSFAAAHHHGEPTDRAAVVRLDFEFSTPAEKLRLATFMQAAILCTLAEEIRQGDPAIKLALSQWVAAEVTDDKLAPLFKGAIVLRHVGLPHLPWDVSFEFIIDGVSYSWYLSNRAFSHGIVQTSAPTAGVGGVPTRQLQDCLLGLSQTATQPVLLPSPMPSFDLAGMCPQANEVITPIMVRTGTGSYDQVLMPFRRAIELLGLPAEPGGQQGFTLAYVLSMLLDDGIIILGEQFRGLGVGGTPPQQAGPYSWEALVSPLRSRAPWAVPMRLFELKNGDPEKRAKYRAIQETFTELAPGRAFEVKFQAIDLEAMNPIAIGTGQTTVFPPATEAEPPRSRPGAAVTVVVDRTGETAHPDDLPIQLHGGGTWEALVIAEALVEAEGRFVILDEPALTLHPTWQRALRSHIQEGAGTFLVITHSENLVPMNSGKHLTRLVRLENEGGATRVHRFPGGLPKDDVSRIVKEFSLSADATSLLFARGVVLLEGETELGTLPKWFESCSAAETASRPADLDLAFYSVGGDKNFRTLLSVMHALAIPWVVVCDGAAFDVRHRQTVLQQVFEAGADASEIKLYLDTLDADPSRRAMDETIFDAARELGRSHGVFTLARGWTTADKDAGIPNDESFEVFLEAVAPGKLATAEREVGNSKVRKGLWVAENVPCPSEVDDLYMQIITLLRQRGIAS